MREIDGDLFERGLELMQYLLVELRSDLLRVEYGIEGVGLVGAH